MAVDPRLSAEEKRNLRRKPLLIPGVNSLDIAQHSGLTGLTRAAGNTAGAVGSAAVDAARTVGGAILYGDEGPQPAPPPVDVPAPDDPALHVPGPQQVRDQRLGGYADTIRQDPGRFGLTRIYKSKDANGNSVYSNVGGAPAGAETRYYNQYGNRETGSGNVDPTVVNPALDPGRTDIGLLVAAGHGRASIPYIQRGQLARAEVDQQAMLDALPPEDRAKLIERQAQEQGLDARAAADRGLRRELAGATNAIAARNADINAANLAFNQDQALSKVERDNPAAAVAQQIDSLKNLGRDQKLRVLSNPNDPRTARILGLVERAAHTAGAGGDTSLAQFRKTGGLRRLLTRSTFSDGSGAFGIGNGFNPNDFGMTEADFQTVIDGYLNAQANANR
jgi:hypothetical protein